MACLVSVSHASKYHHSKHQSACCTSFPLCKIKSNCCEGEIGMPSCLYYSIHHVEWSLIPCTLRILYHTHINLSCSSSTGPHNFLHSLQCLTVCSWWTNYNIIITQNSVCCISLFDKIYDQIQTRYKQVSQCHAFKWGCLPEKVQMFVKMQNLQHNPLWQSSMHQWPSNLKGCALKLL